jgi:hypothetical protein
LMCVYYITYQILGVVFSSFGEYEMFVKFILYNKINII